MGYSAAATAAVGRKGAGGGDREKLGKRSEVSSGICVSGTERWGCSQARRVGMGDGKDWERYLAGKSVHKPCARSPCMTVSTGRNDWEVGVRAHEAVEQRARN